MIAWIPGLGALADRHDGYILDLWGVIHDGVEAYPGVVETLARLRACGKRAVMLSNAPRRADALIDQLARMGIAPDSYDAVLSSGEAVYVELRDRRDPIFAALGRRLYHLGPERDRNVFEGLDFRDVSLDQAEWVLNTGPVDLHESVADYQPVLDRALARRLPMVCANPDHVVIRQGARLTCAGAIAARYTDMGGLVIERGKPDPAIYDLALDLLGLADRRRVCAIGDTLHTDMRGARGAGIESVLVTGGIHCAELGTAWGETPNPLRLTELARHYGERPVAAMATFSW
jgi:HAD superfamily hydrolase (TIGR01459 family)